jgi:glycosyltransferase involved in cell wall biosynthesis
MSKSCIFHIPWAANDECLVPSEIRPRRLIEALKSIGYDVDVVMGDAKQRKIAINRIKHRIAGGKKYDFLYSESSTLPTCLSEHHHYPIHPFLDFSFFSFCKKNSIPIGLFLRDIYWAFPSEYKRFTFIKEQVTTAFHRYDVSKYNQLLDVLFVPNMKMCKHIHGLRKSLPCIDLPAGTDLIECPEDKDRNIFSYVGGISRQFRNVDALFDVFSKLPALKLIASFPERDWLKCSHHYHQKLSPNIEIVHLRGKELGQLYAKASYSLYFAHENSFSPFAMPYKLFEYISYETPIICNRNIAVGEFVEENQIGYTFNKDQNSLYNLLLSLPNEHDYEEKLHNIKSCKIANTWEIRAEQIAQTLMKR